MPGVFERKPNPFEVAGLPTAVEVAVGWGHTCAREGAGTLWCWGASRDGQQGDGSTFAAGRRLGNSLLFDPEGGFRRELSMEGC